MNCVQIDSIINFWASEHNFKVRIQDTPVLDWPEWNLYEEGFVITLRLDQCSQTQMGLRAKVYLDGRQVLGNGVVLADEHLRSALSEFIEAVCGQISRLSAEPQPELL